MLQIALALIVGIATTAVASPPAATVQDAGGQVLVLLRLPAPHVRPGGDYGGGYGDGASRAARHRIAAALARSHGLELVDDWPMPLLGVDCFVLAVPAGQSAATVAASLSNDAGVEWSQPVSIYTAQGGIAEARDPLFLAQPAAVEWHLADLHRIADGRGVRVAVVDSQIEQTHPDLAGQVQLAANFAAGQSDVPEQHGTAVAGIVAAVANNGIGIAGVAPRARLLALRACWQRRTPASATICDSFSLAKAIYFAVEKDAKIVNLSLSGPADPLLARLLDVALRRGIIVVAAYDNALADGGFPASHPGVVAVSNILSAGMAKQVYIAPGRDVPTTQTGGKWGMVSGSSYSAAHVSGLLALLRSQPARPGSARLVVGSNRGVIDSCATLLRGAASDRCPIASERSAELRN